MAVIGAMLHIGAMFHIWRIVAYLDHCRILVHCLTLALTFNQAPLVGRMAGQSTFDVCLVVECLPDIWVLADMWGIVA